MNYSFSSIVKIHLGWLQSLVYKYLHAICTFLRESSLRWHTLYMYVHFGCMKKNSGWISSASWLCLLIFGNHKFYMFFFNTLYHVCNLTSLKIEFFCYFANLCVVTINGLQSSRLQRYMLLCLISSSSKHNATLSEY